MKHIILLSIIIVNIGCQNIQSNSKKNNLKFSDNINHLLESGEIDTLLHLRLSMFEEYTKNKNSDVFTKSSLYKIIDNLDKTCPKYGRMNSWDTRHEDYKLVVTKDSPKRDSFSYDVIFENRTSNEINKMRLDIKVFDIMGNEMGQYFWSCTGNNCLNDVRYEIKKSDFNPKLISLENLKDNVKYFKQDDIFNYSRFILHKLEIEYLNGEKVKYRL